MRQQLPFRCLFRVSLPFLAVRLPARPPALTAQTDRLLHAAAEKRRAAELEKSLAEAGGAAALSTSPECLCRGTVAVKLAKWGDKFFVLTKSAGGGGAEGEPAPEGAAAGGGGGESEGLRLHRFASDVARQPEVSVPLVPGSCAVGIGLGQPSAEDFGLDLFGVGEASTTGIGALSCLYRNLGPQLPLCLACLLTGVPAWQSNMLSQRGTNTTQGSPASWPSWR
eukprot:SAG22_NODE_1564_length_4112_cov_2.178420_4_plen_224_part_00